MDKTKDAQGPQGRRNTLHKMCIYSSVVLGVTAVVLAAVEVSAMIKVDPNVTLSHVAIELDGPRFSLRISGQHDATRMSMKQVSCDMQIACTRQDGLVRFEGSVGNAADGSFDADMTVHTDDWSYFRTQQIDKAKCGSCSFDVSVRFLSLISIPTSVTRQFSTLISDRKDDERTSNISGAAPAEWEPCNTISFYGDPNREFGHIACLQVPDWLLDTARSIGAPSLSLKVKPSSFELTTPRVGGSWEVLLHGLDIPDVLSSPVLPINVSTAFNGLMASPVTSLLAEAWRYGNLNIKLAPSGGDTLGQIIGNLEYNQSVSPPQDALDPLGLSRRLQTDVDNMSKFARQDMWQDARSFCLQYFSPCANFIDYVMYLTRFPSDHTGRQIAKDFLGYLLDKISIGIFVLPQAPLDGASSWTWTSNVTEEFPNGNPKVVKASIRGTDEEHLAIKMTLSDFVLGSTTDFSRINNMDASGYITLSKTLSNWLTVPEGLQNPGGLNLSLDMKNRDGVGEVRIDANQSAYNQLIAASWAYRVGEALLWRGSSTFQVPGGYWSDCYRGPALFPVIGTASFALRDTTALSVSFDLAANRLPFWLYRGGTPVQLKVFTGWMDACRVYLQHMIYYRDIKIEDPVGSTVLTVEAVDTPSAHRSYCGGNWRDYGDWDHYGACFREVLPSSNSVTFQRPALPDMIATTTTTSTSTSTSTSTTITITARKVGTTSSAPTYFPCCAYAVMVLAIILCS